MRLKQLKLDERSESGAPSRAGFFIALQCRRTYTAMLVRSAASSWNRSGRL